MTRQKKYIGVDLHSNQMTCCILHEDGSKERRVFGLTEAERSKFYELLRAT